MPENFADILRRVGRSEDALTGIVPKIERIEVRQEDQGKEQERQGQEQRRQGDQISDLHDEQVGETAIKGWRRNVFLTVISLVGLALTVLSIYAILAART